MADVQLTPVRSGGPPYQAPVPTDVPQLDSTCHFQSSRILSRQRLPRLPAAIVVVIVLGRSGRGTGGDQPAASLGTHA